MTERFRISGSPIEGVRIVERFPRGDARGWLERMFCTDELSVILGSRTIVQVNRTLTKRCGTVRGLHFQHAPHAEMKLVSCLRGEVFDVAVDLRRGSPTLKQWHAERLSEGNGRTFVIPEGVAHGFQTLSDECELLYLHTAAYAPESEDGVNALDAYLAVAWPVPIEERSQRDLHLQGLAADFEGLLV